MMRNRHSQDFGSGSTRANDARESPPNAPPCSLVALHEEVLIPMGPGVFGHRRLRIVRIDQDAAPPQPSSQQARAVLEARPASERRLPAPSPGYRKILAEPGIRLTIPYGKVKSEITPALKDPQRLRDSDQIECYAQIYEAQATVQMGRVAAAELGNPACESQFHPLTRDKAQMFGVPDLFRQTGYPFELRASTRRLYPGQRVYRLRPAFDPTDTGAQANPARNKVPQQYANPLQFRHSREEVLYDMRGVPGTQPPMAGWLGRWLFVYPLRLLMSLAILLFSRPRLKKWRTMLEGKPADHQLWAVTPPRGFARHPAVRRWAVATLTRAGYDPYPMLIEWEIFWRRKGWR